MFNRKIILLLSGIFIIGLVIRFLYFPSNIYFGFDQARDAFAAKEILGGDLKLIGPPTSFEGLHHGVLYYYILAPLYGLGQKSPELVAMALRIFNALGVFLIFWVGKTIFDRKIGIWAALLYAISFEQSQFSIYMGNPSLASLSVTLFYLGLSLLIFDRKAYGLPIALLGLGMSIQFQFALTYLFLPLFLIAIIFHKSFLKIPLKTWLFSIGLFLFSLSTFAVAELKYNFMTLHGLLSLSQFNPDKNIFNMLNTYFFTTNRMIMYNLTGNFDIRWAVAVLLLVFLFWFAKQDKMKRKIVFLAVWFFSIFVTFVINGGVSNPDRDVPLYYPNVGVSISLLIFASLLLERIFSKYHFLAVLILLTIFFANLNLITNLNPKGTISEIDVQQGMLLGDEKRVLDYLYGNAGDKPFAVKAVTMPFYINTTWSYLFEWYGQKTYGYLPIWNGKNALGFPGNLKVENAQDKAPPLRYLIIEPVRGIPTYLIDDYLREESYFTDIDKEVKIGRFQVQVRHKK